MSQIDIPRLIDMALVTQTGNLNLKILHKVLHAIASQLNLNTTKKHLKNNLEPTKITEMEDEENWTKENEENYEENLFLVSDDSNLDDDEDLSQKFDEIENLENEENEETLTDLEENVKKTKLPKNFNCLTKKVENLQKNLCHLKKSFHG